MTNRPKTGDVHKLYLLESFCRGLEFWARLVLVNIPSYLLAHSPELDRVILFSLNEFLCSFLLFLPIVGL